MKEDKLCKLRAEQTDTEEQLTTTTKEIKKHEQDVGNSKVQIEKLRADHPWIDTEKQLFGLRGHMYDFKKMDIASLKKQC